MSEEFLSRTKALLGEEGVRALAEARVLLLGLGGVGGYAFEALVRSGLGHLTVVDFDRFSESNLNRQLLATRSVIGEKKTEIALARAKEISPSVAIRAISERVTPENAPSLVAGGYDLVIDAIDGTAAKAAVAKAAGEQGIPLIMCLGTALRRDPSALEITDLAKTESCPLARRMRQLLRRDGLSHVTVLFSRETPLPHSGSDEPLGSLVLVPAAAGLLLAAAAVDFFTGKRELFPPQ